MSQHRLIISSSHHLIIFCILSFAFCISCRNNKHTAALKDPSPYFTNFYTGDGESVLHGINFGTTADDVRKEEKAKLYESTADHLFYIFSYPKDSMQYADIHYFFNEENTLDIITANIYLSDSSQQDKLKNTLAEYFNDRYGSSEQDDYDYDVWHGSGTNPKTDTKFSYSIALSGLTNDYGVSLEYMKE